MYKVQKYFEFTKHYIHWTFQNFEITIQWDNPIKRLRLGWDYYKYGWPEIQIYIGFIGIWFSWMRNFHSRFNEDGTEEVS